MLGLIPTDNNHLLNARFPGELKISLQFITDHNNVPRLASGFLKQSSKKLRAALALGTNLTASEQLGEVSAAKLIGQTRNG